MASRAAKTEKECVKGNQISIFTVKYIVIMFINRITSKIHAPMAEKKAQEALDKSVTREELRNRRRTFSWTWFEKASQFRAIVIIENRLQVEDEPILLIY